MTDTNDTKHDIRAIVIDVDGTLLNNEHTITPRTEKAIKDAIAKGVQVVLATGKTHKSTQSIIDQFGLETPGIYLQGLAIYDQSGAIRHQTTLAPELARQALTFIEDRGFVVAAYHQDRILVRARHAQLEEELVKRHEVAPEAVGPLQNLLGKLAINKLIVIGERKAINALRWQLSMQVGGAGRLLQPGIDEMLELLPPGSSKGAALKTLAKDIGVDVAQILAIGDGENDIEMIQIAGVGVAMGQANQKVKDAADYVTASNDEDGVAQAIERYVLGKTEAESEPEAGADKPDASAGAAASGAAKDDTEAKA